MVDGNGAGSRSSGPTTGSPKGYFDLTGKVALVTGGSRGMGRSMVLGLAHAGADVVIASRKLEACRAVAAEVEEATGRAALPVACHVGRWEDVEHLVEAAYERFERIDVLVNNAGMSPGYPDVTAVSQDMFDKVVAVNLRGPFRLTALVGSRMVADGGGSVINVSSHSAEYPDRYAIPYAAAKAGLNAMTTAFADAFGPTVRVNCIQPGAFLTDISRSWDPDWFAERAQSYALGRGAEADEVVGTVLYLACERASSYTTGAVIRVDGGNFGAPGTLVRDGTDTSR
jgi:NAD(P)-dependent dehydrogenase (short-subunit alcohol dehydrogenase family)